MTHPSVQRTAYQNSYYPETLPQPTNSSSSRPSQPAPQTAQALPGTFPTVRNAYHPQPPLQQPSEPSLPHYHPPTTAHPHPPPAHPPTSPPLTPFPPDMNGSAPRTRPDVANGLLKKEMYEYKAPWPVYGLDWSKRPGEKSFRLALGSFIEEFKNKVRLSELSFFDSEWSSILFFIT
jgi:hypothetical protein